MIAETSRPAKYLVLYIANREIGFIIFHRQPNSTFSATMHLDRSEYSSEAHNRFERAARQLIHARKSSELLSRLSEDVQPRTIDEAHQIQAATASLLQETVAGWKVANAPTGEFMYGAVLASLVFHAPARISQRLRPMMVVEVEVAFRFTRDLPQRSELYRHEEVLEAVQPFAAIEVVDSRYAKYAETPWLQRTADFTSNGAFVKGDDFTNWATRDLSQLEVGLTVGANTIVAKKGGHPTGDPFSHVVTFVNFVRANGGVKAGQFITTGSYTGVTRVRTGERVCGHFDSSESAAVEFVQ
ncbi:2-keto-4-pentenoate hydratase [Paraburkholderia youngii]|uniref:hypothetical protein n=1 Tax=Paraburkholderia youngii TaxID=2782701 RepID=UPI003D25090D